MGEKFKLKFVLKSKKGFGELEYEFIQTEKKTPLGEGWLCLDWNRRLVAIPYKTLKDKEVEVIYDENQKTPNIKEYKKKMIKEFGKNVFTPLTFKEDE